MRFAEILFELVDLWNTKRHYSVERQLSHRAGVKLDPSWWEKLTDREKLAVQWYRDAGHGAINALLRNQTIDLEDYQTDTDVMQAEYGYSMTSQEAIDLLDAAIQKSRFNSDVAVYRGLKQKADADAMAAMQIGESLVDPAFISATMEPRYAYYSFAYQTRIVLRLIVPQGVPAAYVSHNDGTEAEVLLGRGRHFTLSERRRVRPRQHKSYELLTFTVR